MQPPMIIFPELVPLNSPVDGDDWSLREGISQAARYRWEHWLKAPRYRFRYSHERDQISLECCPGPSIEELKIVSRQEHEIAEAYFDSDVRRDQPPTFSFNPSGLISISNGAHGDSGFWESAPRGSIERVLPSITALDDLMIWDKRSVRRWYDAACFILFCECLSGNLGLQESDKITTAVYIRERSLVRLAALQMGWMLDAGATERSRST